MKELSLFIDQAAWRVSKAALRAMYRRFCFALNCILFGRLFRDCQTTTTTTTTTTTATTTATTATTATTTATTATTTTTTTMELGQRYNIPLSYMGTWTQDLLRLGVASADWSPKPRCRLGCWRIRGLSKVRCGV